MSWESDSGIDLKDRTKLVWFGIVGGSLFLIGLFWFLTQNPKTVHSKARVYQIVINMGRDPAGRAAALELTTELRQRIIDGQSFSSIAKNYSNHDYTAARGGDTGWVGMGGLVDVVDNYVWTCRLNEVSDVIQAANSFYLVLVTDRFIADADKYEEELRERVISGAAEDAPEQESNP